jgi:hypothetical protein
MACPLESSYIIKTSSVDGDLLVGKTFSWRSQHPEISNRPVVEAQEEPFPDAEVL